MASGSEGRRPQWPSAPPGSWWLAHRLARRAIAPVERFLQVEAASGILLLLAAALALVWANSPWSSAYSALWHTPVGVHFGDFAFERDLHFWINDGVMTIFFFVVGLEIRGEIHHGELSDARRAALPLFAALGGMLVPAAIFASFNAGHASLRGWGVPMATDIAFAVGVLTLLGSRVPATLRVLLLALAVIDDVGAILVIALFYSSELQPLGFAVLGAGLGAILLQRAMGVTRPWLYVPAGILSWAGAYAAGIHPTLAGVAIGLLTPVQPWPNPDGDGQSSPAQRIEHALHDWVAFGAMPLFAFANAGVSLGSAEFAGDSLLAFVGIFCGLVLGKPIGVVAASWLATRLGIAVLPRGTSWKQIALVGVVAGIGFTMSIFIAGLAFGRGPTLETGKIAILLGSFTAAVLTYGFGRAILPQRSSATRNEAVPELLGNSE
ncbi:MAG TPA: Na+/H+ antiporter NhaA [Polyangiaceae bacterium]|nr:Na+/H+ antiporter NhaA [Polyangiaceae bacterium]